MSVSWSEWPPRSGSAGAHSGQLASFRAFVYVCPFLTIVSVSPVYAGSAFRDVFTANEKVALTLPDWAVWLTFWVPANATADTISAVATTTEAVKLERRGIEPDPTASRA